MGKVKRQITSYRQTGESKAEISFHFLIEENNVSKRWQAVIGMSRSQELCWGGVSETPFSLEKFWVLARSSTKKKNIYRHVTPPDRQKVGSLDCCVIQVSNMSFSSRSCPWSALNLGRALLWGSIPAMWPGAGLLLEYSWPVSPPGFGVGSAEGSLHKAAGLTGKQTVEFVSKV